MYGFFGGTKQGDRNINIEVTVRRGPRLTVTSLLRNPTWTLGSNVCYMHTFQISKTERALGNIRPIGWSRLQLAGAESEVQKLSKEEINLNAWEEKEK